MKTVLLAALLAFVMPTSGVLKRYASNRDGLSTSAMKAEGVAVISPVLAKDLAPLLGINWNSGDLNVNATLLVRLPGRCRLELSTPESTKTIAVSSANGTKHTEGGEVPALSAALTQACAVLAVRSGDESSTRENLVRILQGLKIDTRSVALARLDDSVRNVSYLIGNRAEGQPQFWVSKENFLPSRLKYADDKGTWDLRFTDFESQATDDVWPRVLEILKGSEPQLRVMILKADLHADLSSTKF